MKILFNIEKESCALLLGATGLPTCLGGQHNQAVSRQWTQKNYSFEQVFSGEKVSLPPKKNKNIGSSHSDAKRLSIVTIART